MPGVGGEEAGHLEESARAGDVEGTEEGIGVDEIRVVVEKLITFRGDNGLRLASEEEKQIFVKMQSVLDRKEWVPGLKTQDRRKVNKEVSIVVGRMHNLVKNGCVGN